MQNSSPTINGPKSGTIESPVDPVANQAAQSAHTSIDKTSKPVGSAGQSLNFLSDRAMTAGQNQSTHVEKRMALSERRIQGYINAVNAAQKNTVEDARKYVATHPWQSVVFAVVAGVLVGRRTSKGTASYR